MRARELASPCVGVEVDASAVEAARLLISEGHSGLVVWDRSGQPCAILTADQLLRIAVPAYVREDRGLAGVIDEPHADLVAVSWRSGGSPTVFLCAFRCFRWLLRIRRLWRWPR
ncbi:CBS domain-containing protein [Nocardia amamiensis]|uniref:CBS domain-containing protein n=1 Tax=Nocardia amamiensis TaxID=404578 RepID=UPI000A83D760